jgi:hypothetical protein
MGIIQNRPTLHPTLVVLDDNVVNKPTSVRVIQSSVPGTDNYGLAALSKFLHSGALTAYTTISKKSPSFYRIRKK